MTNGLNLDLETIGPHSYLPVRRPTRQELNNSDLDLIMLTSPHGCDSYHVNSLRTITGLRSCPISHYLRTAIFRNFN